METLESAGGVLLREGTRCAYFHPGAMRLFRLNAPAAAALSEVAESIAGKLPDLSLEQPKGANGHREALLPVLAEAQQDKPGPLDESTIPAAKPHLGRLTIHISNTCNLACTYCYATRGNAQNRLMSTERMGAVLDRVLEFYGDIAVVHLFGGEPLMNLPAIDAAGEYLESCVREGSLPRMPRLALTTNGTWSSPAVLDTLKRWKIALTVSWDGTRAAQDTCRPTRSGAPSYELLANSLERFREHEIPFEIECTYNGYHRRSGISIVDLMRFFHERTGKRVLHIAPVFLPRRPAQPREETYIDVAELEADYREAARFSIDNLIAERGPVLQLAFQVASHLASRTPARTYCPAFFSQLTVAADGEVYPCFMLAGDPAYCMGNLLDGSFPGQRAVAVVRRYFDEFNARPESWYSCLSEGCIAGEAIVSGVMSDPVMAPIQKAIAEECVLRLAAHPMQK